MARGYRLGAVGEGKTPTEINLIDLGSTKWSAPSGGSLDWSQYPPNLIINQPTGGYIFTRCNEPLTCKATSYINVQHVALGSYREQVRVYDMDTGTTDVLRTGTGNDTNYIVNLNTYAGHRILFEIAWENYSTITIQYILNSVIFYS